MDEVRILATGLGFPEGPVTMPDGSVILTEIRNNRCSRVAPDGKVSLFSSTGVGQNGLAVGPDGVFYLCRVPRYKVRLTLLSVSEPQRLFALARWQDPLRRRH